MILVTGGAGFIGSNFVLDWIAASGESVVNLDALTYAGNRENLASLDGVLGRHPRYVSHGQRRSRAHHTAFAGKRMRAAGTATRRRMLRGLRVAGPQ